MELKEKELQRKELMLEMTKILVERKIPVQFMEYLIADYRESTLEKITIFEKQYKSAIENDVNEKLKGKAPTAGAGSKNTSIQNTPRVDEITEVTEINYSVGEIEPATNSCCLDDCPCRNFDYFYFVMASSKKSSGVASSVASAAALESKKNFQPVENFSYSGKLIIRSPNEYVNISADYGTATLILIFESLKPN